MAKSSKDIKKLQEYKKVVYTTKIKGDPLFVGGIYQDVLKHFKIPALLYRIKTYTPSESIQENNSIDNR